MMSSVRHNLRIVLVAAALLCFVIALLSSLDAFDTDTRSWALGGFVALAAEWLVALWPPPQA